MTSTAVKNRRRGKRVEKKVTDLYRTFDEELRRIGVLGSEDVIGSKFVIEVKSRESLPKWLIHAFEQLRESQHPHKFHVIHVHLTGNRYITDVVIMSVKTFFDICKKLFSKE